MTKRKNKLNLVIDFLEKELLNLEIQIKEEQGKTKNKIEFKEQVKDYKCTGNGHRNNVCPVDSVKLRQSKYVGQHSEQENDFGQEVF